MSASVGTRGTSMKQGGSVELEGGVTGGIGNRTGALVLSEKGSIGVASNGDRQGRLLSGVEFDWYGDDDFGWQAGLFSGYSLGGFQAGDYTYSLEAGPHWNFTRNYDDREQITTGSLALDLGVGYASHENPDRADGVILSLSLVVRYDYVSIFSMK